jgi:ribonuclease-3
LVRRQNREHPADLIIMQLDYSALEKHLQLSFRDAHLLEQALIHRSYLNEHSDCPTGHNERLEFLGDAVLELVVTEYLYQHYPNPEGELTNWRSALVNSRSLSTTAKTLGIEPYILMSRGESRDANSKARQSILANAVEALIGAIYLDQGWEGAKTFVTEHILSRLPAILEHKLYMDPKSRFQENAQELLGVTPTYRVLEESGPDHSKKFVVGVYIAEEHIASGDGTSKQEAQVQAAENALKIKHWD